jgi:Flp pilus assembly protein protease CpaA
MYLALIGFSLYISYIDLKSHRIPNKILFCALLLFLSITVAQGAPVYLKSAVISILISLPLVKFRVGAGDIKLLILTAFFFLPPNLEILIRFLSAFSAIAVSLIFFTLFKEKSLQSSIALAPAICGAVIWSAS